MEKNDLMKNYSKKKFSLNDLNNEDELDFSFKDLDRKEFDAFCHAITSWHIMTSYQLAEELLSSDANFDNKKDLQMKSLKKKKFLIQKITLI